MPSASNNLMMNAADLFKDPVMLQRLAELDRMDNTEKSHILHVLDGFIKSVKLKNIAAL